MKILQIFGAVVAVHVLAFIFIFASPGCSSSPRNIPTPDATAPTAGSVGAPVSGGVSYTPSPVDLGTAPAYSPATQPGRAEPTRPGSPNAAAIATPKPAAADVAPVSTYTVARGDSLWSIAKKNRLTVGELAKANNLSTGATLQPGKKLIIPGKAPSPQDLAAAPAASAPKSEPKATTPARSAEALHHTVAAGESLGTIARKYQVTVGELAAANNITDPAKIRAGQQLVIPGFKAVNSGSRTASTPRPTTPAPTTPAQTPATQPAQTEPTVTTPRFEIAPPPPGQDLDAGLKDTATDVPTIKVEEPKSTPPKS
jgi:LysM repeat protein